MGTRAVSGNFTPWQGRDFRFESALRGQKKPRCQWHDTAAEKRFCFEGGLLKPALHDSASCFQNSLGKPHDIVDYKKSDDPDHKHRQDEQNETIFDEILVSVSKRKMPSGVMRNSYHPLKGKESTMLISSGELRSIDSKLWTGSSSKIYGMLCPCFKLLILLS